MSMLFPKPQKPPPPPPTPRMADTALTGEQGDSEKGYSSLISTSPTGLKRKGTTAKRTLIGGSASP